MNYSDSSGVALSFADSCVLRVDFYLDLICPWCWIGLRNLRTAWSDFAQQHPERVMATVWHADTLLPQIPEQGIPYQTFYENRLGGAQAVRARRAQIRSVAEPLNLNMKFEEIETFPNTGLVCSLVNFAQTQLAPEAMFAFVDSIFSAYFEHGQNIGDAQVLQGLAQLVGMKWEPGTFDLQDYRDGMGHAGGVPHYVFNQRWAESGAVPVAQLQQCMNQAVAQMSHD